MDEVERLRLLDDEALRALILEIAPDLRARIEHMNRLFAQLVEFERRKLGLDQPKGEIFLSKNLAKNLASDPDLVGSGMIAGRHYQAAAWLQTPNKIKISLLFRKPK